MQLKRLSPLLALLALGMSSTLTLAATTYQLRQAAPGLTASTQQPALPAPAISLSAASVTLSSPLKGTAATPQTVTVTNTGTADLTVSQVSLGGANSADFSISGCAAATLTAGTSCTLTLGFTPTSTANETATVTLTHNAAGGSTVLNVTGANTGAVDASFNSVSFLAHMDGVAGATTFSDVKGSTLTNNGSVTVSTSGAKWGTGGALFSGTNSLLTNASPAFTFGTGDFTVEASAYFTTTPGTGANCANLVGVGSLWQLCATPTYIGWWNAAYGATQFVLTTLANNTWYTVAIVRSSGTLRFYLNGNFAHQLLHLRE